MSQGDARLRSMLLALFALLGACAERPTEPPVASTQEAIVLLPPWLLNNTAPIPGNGGLLISTQSGGEPTIDVRSVAAPGVAIAGSVRALEGYWVWTADSPLPEGSYTATISDPIFTNEPAQPFEVTSERTFQKPALTSDPQIAINEVVAQSECCWSLVNRQRVDGSCFAVAWQDGVLLSTNVATSESASALTQLLFSIAPAMQPGFEMPGLFTEGSSIAFTFGAQADAYCFDITVIEIANGERYTFEELERCALHDVRALGMRMTEPSAADLDATVCPAPPDGYEASWCELNEEPCAAEPARAGCELAGHVCRGEPLPGTMTTGGTGGMISGGGAGGTSGMAGASGPAGDGSSGWSAGNDDLDDREPRPSGSDEDVGLRASGCGCRAYPARETSAWPALALLGGALGLLRLGTRSRSRARSGPGRSP